MSSGAWSGQPSGDPFGAAWYGEEGQLSTHVQGPRMCRVHACAGSPRVQGPRVCRVHMCAGSTCVQGPRVCRVYVCAGVGLSSTSHGPSEAHQASSFYSYTGTCRNPHLRIGGGVCDGL